LGPRDIQPAARSGLPPDLAACVTPACLKALGEASGADHVLALEVLEDAAGPVLFATIYDAGDGAVVDQRGLTWPGGDPAPRAWADELARWLLRAPAPPVPPPEREARLAIALAPEQAGRPEARALVAELAGRLQARGAPRLAGPAAATHQAVVAVERV